MSHTKSLKDKSRIRNEISKVITSRSDKEGMFEDNSDDEVSASEKTSDSLFVRRKWIPKQIADEEKEKA